MTYSKEQIMLTFAYMSYYGLSFAGTDEANDHRIAELICQALKTWTPIQNEWQLVWGPCVSAFKGDLFDDNIPKAFEI